MSDPKKYAFQTKTSISFHEAIDKVTDLLKKEGFGVLTEIDVKDVLKKKLNLEYKPYRILGACNPMFASQTLQIEPFVGLFLPCNVVVWDDGNSRTVAAMDPRIIADIIDIPELTVIAKEISDRIRRVIESI